MSPPKRHRDRQILKILAFAAALLFMATVAIRYFHLSPLILSGPQSVVELLTDSGLKSDNNRINILLLGTGGEGHEGPNLSDTMIILSVEKNGKDIALISIPRDVWAPELKRKINAAYAVGQEKEQIGLELAEKTVSHLFGLPIHYGVRLDFSGFEKAIDQIGGLDIDVDNAFRDQKYPLDGKENDTCGYEIETKIEDGVKNVYFKDATGSGTLLKEDNDPFTCRYETLVFESGSNHMDGKTALKYVRSRHGNNNEGTDFARSARQEKVILAFRKEVLSSETLLNPKRILDLLSTFGRSIDTDITSSEIPLFVTLLPKIDQSAVRKIGLDSDRPQSRLEVGDPRLFQGQFVLIPKNGHWQELADYVQGEVFRVAVK
ncbi:LCP family protein [Candidatus Curtissbacteria bacterium]|nr:LCP family protein [Candidatus Curtissbacteria bacterium]